MHGRIGGWVDEWMCGRMDGGLDGWKDCLIFVGRRWASVSTTELHLTLELLRSGFLT